MTTTTSTVRLTKRDFFNAALSSLDMNAEFTIPKGDGFVKISGADMAGFYNHEIELLDRKNTVDKKPTATQVANEGIKADIKAFLDAHKGEKFTVSALKRPKDPYFSIGLHLSSLYLSLRAYPIPITTPPSICPSTDIGLIALPTS